MCPVAEGGLTFRARFGVGAMGQPSCRRYSLRLEIRTAYPEFTADLLKKLGWWDDLSDAEKQAAEGKNWKNDLSGGIQRVAIGMAVPRSVMPARTVVWTFPDPVPVHREPLYTNRRDLVDKYPTRRPQIILAPSNRWVDQAKDYSKEFPNHPHVGTAGRIRGWR